MALDLLAEARAARARLADAADATALHDFRVALRRLRSWLRAFRGSLEDEPSGRVRRGLRSLAAATGASRDAEVQIDWLAPRRARLPLRHRSALLALMRHFETQRETGVKQVARAATRFDALSERIEQDLVSYRPLVSVRAPQTPSQSVQGRASAVLSRRISEQADALRDRLSLVKSRADEAHAHEARIEGKRLRYLLEPLRGKTRGAREVVSQLKKLQDILGELHDAHVLSGVTGKLFPEPKAAPARPREGHATLGEFALAAATPRQPPGAAALREAVRRREATAFGVLERTWLGARVATLHAATCAVAATLNARAHEGLEIERKYLLSGLPGEARRARYVTIDQGYLPGRVIGERIRRVRDGRRIDHVRSLKAGTGMVRVELEEKTPKAIFDGLWLLTRGRRLRKRRHVVPAGDLHWEIDFFLDRDLVLAEVEIPSEDTPVPIPDWLAPFIIREVTSERRYENHQIALARPRGPKARE